MLRRQQATAIITAREKIVEGAVSMVKMALDQLKDQGVVELDEERRAAMVSNLLVVLCADEPAQPVLNTALFTSNTTVTDMPDKKSSKNFLLGSIPGPWRR